MRLIDADKIIELFTSYISEDKKVVYQPRALKKDDIKNAPTIDAIPIEWIKKYAENDDIAASIYRMLEAWEEANR